MLIVVLGLNEAATEAVVEQIATGDVGDDYEPIFLTDLDQFDVFASKNLVFEHIASKRSRSLAPADLPWDHYLQRRFDLLQSKWHPVATIPFGAIASQAVSEWREAGECEILSVHSKTVTVPGK